MQFINLSSPNQSVFSLLFTFIVNVQKSLNWKPKIRNPHWGFLSDSVSRTFGLLISFSQPTTNHRPPPQQPSLVAPDLFYFSIIDDRRRPFQQPPWEPESTQQQRRLSSLLQSSPGKSLPQPLVLFPCSWVLLFPVPGVLFFHFSVSYSDVVMLILVWLDSQAPTLTAILSCICSASVVTAQNRGKLHIFIVSLQWGFQNRGSVCVSVTLFFLALDLDAELWIVNLWWMDFIECCWCCCLDFENKVCESVIVNGLRENWVLILKMVCLFFRAYGTERKTL